jgi:hypothetical protein
MLGNQTAGKLVPGGPFRKVSMDNDHFLIWAIQVI